MKTGVGLCVLGLLCLHSSVLGEPLVQDAAARFCDDPAVEKAAFSAVHQFNERLSSGHKLALFQILSASLAVNRTGSQYSLRFTSRRSDCEAGSKRPWTDCQYLSTGLKEPMACNATVYTTDTETHTEQVDCHLDDYVISGRAPCLGCPEEIDENSDDLKAPLSASISKYNSISNSSHLFAVHSVGHATRQVVAGFRYKLRFDMRKTTCAKDTHAELNELCVVDEVDVEYTQCNSTVDTAPWRLEPAEAQIECEAGALPPAPFNRRRPPGWSPLRKFLYPTASATAQPSPAPSQAASPSPSSSPSPSPSKASAKEESSEEDIVNPTAATDGAPKAVNGNRYHCPSKPWKPFHPVDPTVTVTVDVVAIEPAGGKDLSDSDLLA